MDTRAGDRQQRRKQRTREAVLDAALGLFSERGYAATTMSAIADAADVAVRTVTVHFPTKADLLFDTEPFTLERLAFHLDNRAAGQSTLEAVRAWMATTMQDLGTESTEVQQRIWQRRALRAQVITANDELRARARAGYYPFELFIAAHIGADLGQSANALTPRLAAATVVIGLRELYQTDEARTITAAEPTDSLLHLVDEVLAFAAAGIAASGS